MRDLRHAKPGEVYRDRYGNVWGVTCDKDAVMVLFAFGVPSSRPREVRLDAPALAEHGPFVLLTPEEESEW